MEGTGIKKITRDQIYKDESNIIETLGEFYNPTMSHKMKARDTFKNIFPTSDLWKDDIIFKTTNTTLQPESYKDPYFNDRYYLKTDWNKKYTEEMLKAKNMMMKKTKDGEKK